MEIKLFTPHTKQKQIIDSFANSQHKFGIVATGRQFGKSLLGQNLLLYWLLKNPNQKAGWISPIYNQCKKVFKELTNATHAIISEKNKADLSIKFINGSTINFLGTYQVSTEVLNEIDLGSFISLVRSSAIASGIIFELPIVIYFLTKAGVVTPDSLVKYRKYALVLVLILAAVITPPDVASQIIVAIPIVVLYQVSIFISRIVVKNQSK